MSYYIAGNRCDCHPETCCCVDYALYKRGLIDTKIATSDYRDDLEKLEYQYNLNRIILNKKL